MILELCLDPKTLPTKSTEMSEFKTSESDERSSSQSMIMLSNKSIKNESNAEDMISRKRLRAQPDENENASLYDCTIYITPVKRARLHHLEDTLDTRV